MTFIESRDGEAHLCPAAFAPSNFALSVFLQDGYNHNRLVTRMMQISPKRKTPSEDFACYRPVTLRLEVLPLLPNTKEKFSWPKT